MSKVIINCIAKSIIFKETDSNSITDRAELKAESYGILMG